MHDMTSDRILHVQSRTMLTLGMLLVLMFSTFRAQQSGLQDKKPCAQRTFRNVSKGKYNFDDRD